MVICKRETETAMPIYRLSSTLEEMHDVLAFDLSDTKHIRDLGVVSTPIFEQQNAVKEDLANEAQYISI
jgi:hypothetical protein